MPSLTGPSAIAGLTILVLVFFLNVPIFWSYFYKARSRERTVNYESIHKLYEDRDGVATEESQKEYSAAIPKYTALICSITGLAASIAISVLASIHPVNKLCVENWLRSGTWVRGYRSCTFKALIHAGFLTLTNA